MKECISAENNLMKSKNSEYFLLITKQKDIWKISPENMEDKILGFQFALVPSKPPHPSYNDGSDVDPQKQPSEVFCRKSALETLQNSL